MWKLPYTAELLECTLSSSEVIIVYLIIFLSPNINSKTIKIPIQNNSPTFTARKLSPLSVARALAIMVFEQPGGPYIRIPLGGLIPILWNASGYLNGHSTACFSFSLTSSWPPMSDQWTCKETDNKEKKNDAVNNRLYAALQASHSKIRLFFLLLLHSKQKSYNSFKNQLKIKHRTWNIKDRYFWNF